MESRPCKNCGAQMVKKPGPGRWQLYCSPECKRVALGKVRSLIPNGHPCLHCGDPTPPGHTRKYCSPLCRRRALHARTRGDGRYAAKLAEQNRKNRERIERESVPCPYCAVLMFSIRGLRAADRKQCGAATCKKAYNRDRVREQQRRYRAQWRARGESYAMRNLSPEQRQRRLEELAALNAVQDPARRRARKQEGWQRRRAQKRTVPFEVFRHVDVYDRDGWICGICKDPVDPTLQHPDPMSVSLDHVIPLSAGGPHIVANTQCSHLSCNTRKNARILEVADEHEADTLRSG